jgi:hypothetical protein
VVSRIRGKGIRGKQSVYLKFVRAFALKESLQYYSFPVRDPCRIHDQTTLRAVSTISLGPGAYAHSLWLAVFTIQKVFFGSDPGWLPVRVVSRSKHVASELEGLLSLSPPCLQLLKLSWLISCESVGYPVVCSPSHVKYKVNVESKTEYGSTRISHLAVPCSPSLAQDRLCNIFYLVGR